MPDTTTKTYKSSFTWNGIPSTQYGIVVLQQPSFVIPKERYSSVVIPGRTGRLTVNEGGYIYDNMQLSCTCLIPDPKIPGLIGTICLWLSGGTALIEGDESVSAQHTNPSFGTLRFSSRPGGYYKARIANQVPFEKLIRGNAHCTFTIVFDCEPFFYMDEGEIYTRYQTTSVTLENPGNFYSEPLIRVRLQKTAAALSDGELIVKDKSEQKVISKTILHYDKLYWESGTRRYMNVFIDGESKMAHSYDGRNLSPAISGDWPIFPSDSKCKVSISWHAAKKLAIQPRWRCIG